MDTSEQYIKMCEKATEIQAQWKPQDGDFMCHKETRAIFVVGDWAAGYIANYENEPIYGDSYTNMFEVFDGGYEWEDRDIGHKNEFIWLHRQDQLQIIIYGENQNTLYGKYPSPDWNDLDRVLIKKSFEMLWLSYVMKIKYNKQWNGEDWLSI